jgi:hypothetical protein
MNRQAVPAALPAALLLAGCGAHGENGQRTAELKRVQAYEDWSRTVAPDRISQIQRALAGRTEIKPCE